MGLLQLLEMLLQLSGQLLVGMWRYTVGDPTLHQPIDFVTQLRCKHTQELVVLLLGKLTEPLILLQLYQQLLADLLEECIRRLLAVADGSFQLGTDVFRNHCHVFTQLFPQVGVRSGQGRHSDGYHS
uniref:Secreted protein n=1 Tax=Anopheles funestus TaxID=62324 RepID=A0A4Y0BLP1_ANOFN